MTGRVERRPTGLPFGLQTRPIAGEMCGNHAYASALVGRVRWYRDEGDVMWSFIARLGVLLLLASLAQPLPHARAQQVQQAAPTDQDMAAELSRLIERWQKTDDPEEQIAALEAALRLEPQIRQWPLQASREQVRGMLLSGLGDSYQKRRQGNRADNLEAAIKAYEAALTVFTREAFPQDWAETQNNLAIAY